MASAEQYAQWLIDNQERKGSPEFETVASAYKLARSYAQQADQPKEPTVGERISRVAGLGARAAGPVATGAALGAAIGAPIGGVGAIPGAMAGAGAAALTQMVDRLSGMNVTEGLMDKLGLPRPETPIERVSSDVVSGLGGLAGVQGIARGVTSGIQGAPTLGQGIAQQFARQPLPQAVAATTGAGSASTARESGAGPTGQLMAGLAGAFAPSAATSVVSGGLNVGRALIDPTHKEGQHRILGNLLRNITGDQADDIASRLKNAREIVPGSKPTAGQVSQSGAIAAQERAISGETPGIYSKRMMEQNTVRLNVLRNIAKTPEDISAAEAARDAATAPLYDTAKKVTVRADETLNSLLKRPSMKEAWTRASRIANERGESLEAAQGGTYSGRLLHYLKLGMDDLLDDPQSAIGRMEKASIMDTRKRLGEWLGQKIPEYGRAREVYAEMSRPITQIEIGQALLNKLEPALTQGDLPIRMRASSFADALRKGDDFVKQVTGFKGATLSNTLSQEQLAALDAVKKDLARSAIAGDLGRGVGSNTFQNISQENLFQAAGVQGLPQLLSRPVQLTNYALRGIYGSANREMKDQLLEILMDPQLTAQTMAGATPGAIQRLSGLLAQGRGPVVSASPMLFGINEPRK